MSAVEEYLRQFYDNPYKIEEYKINFLKNHFYDRVNSIMNIEFKDFLIGVNSHKRDLIYFKSKKNNEPLIYNNITDKFENINLFHKFTK